MLESCTHRVNSGVHPSFSLERCGDVRVHLLNPANHSFGVATITITPRWLYVLAGATPAEFGDPIIVDEAVAPIDPDSIQPGDIVGIGIHTSNALRGYEVGRL